MKPGSSNTKSGQTRPRPRSSTGPPVSSGRRRSSRRTDRVEALLSPAPRGCRRRVGSRQASSLPEPGRPPEPKSCCGLHSPQHLRQRRNIGSGTHTHHRRPERDLDCPTWNCAGGRCRRRWSLHHHLRESHAARGGRSAPAADNSSLRIASPAEQLLRRQSMSPRDCRDFVPALIALCDNLRFLFRRPNAPPSGPGENLKPTNGLPLRLVQKLSIRHVSNSLLTQRRQTITHSPTPWKVRSEGR
jgi:hypothetical protein